MFVPLDVKGYQYNLRALKEIYEKKNPMVDKKSYQLRSWFDSNVTNKSKP